jgi:UTP-glucose-1-phosphate uridylyltransferase
MEYELQHSTAIHQFEWLNVLHKEQFRAICILNRNTLRNISERVRCAVLNELLRDRNDTESSPRTKDYEVRCRFLVHQGQNDGCGHKFLCVREFLEDNRTDIFHRATDAVWNGGESDVNQSIAENPRPCLGVQENKNFLDI